jgi:hypothetical protein
MRIDTKRTLVNVGRPIAAGDAPKKRGVSGGRCSSTAEMGAPII